MHVVDPPIDSSSIEKLGTTSAEWLSRSWTIPCVSHGPRLADAFARAGDRAYGTYLGLLFRPLKVAMRTVGLRVYPPLPGALADSREWGNADETEQQRWFWSGVAREHDGSALGTLVTVLHHDHNCFRLPRPPEIFALRAIGTDAVERELSALNASFASALPMREWVTRFHAEHSHAEAQ